MNNVKLGGFLITFTIPFYDNEELLKKAVESVIQQSCTDWRLIISLDSELSQDFIFYLDSLKDKRIQVINNEIENKGISGNWNKCIEAVESDYVTILHSDDELAPNYIQTIKTLIERDEEAALYFCGAEIINDDSQPVFSFVDKVKSFIQPKTEPISVAGDLGLASLLKGCYMFCPTICYKTEVIKKYKFRQKWQMVLDLDLYTRLLLDGNKFIGTHLNAYYYRRHLNNQTAKLTQNMQRFEEEVAFYNFVNAEVDSQWPLSAKVAQNKSIIKLHLLFLIAKNLCSFNFSQVKVIACFYIKQTK